jgi:hypothetical protein
MGVGKLGGAASFVGSAFPLLIGNVESILAAFAYSAGEVAFMHSGEKAKGYSIGAVAYATGELALAYSPNVLADPELHSSILWMCSAWALAAARYPSEICRNYLLIRGYKNSAKLFAIGNDLIQPIVGVLTVGLSLPVVFHAISGESYYIAAGSAFWMIGDYLDGKFHVKIPKYYGALKNFLSFW